MAWKRKEGVKVVTLLCVQWLLVLIINVTAPGGGKENTARVCAVQNKENFFGRKEQDLSRLSLTWTREIKD